MRNGNTDNTSNIEEAQAVLVTELVDTESAHELDLIEKKLNVLRRLKE